MSKHEREQSIFEEPHLRKSHFDADPSESIASQTLQKGKQGEQERLEQSVFEEVALSQLTDRGVLYEYFVWRRDGFNPWLALAFFVLVSVCTGTFSIVIAMLYSMTAGGFTGLGIFGAVTVAPPVEEFAKILLPIWLIEQRPWLFRWRWEIPLVCIAGGVGFAVIENLMYLHVYIDQPSSAITIWRWTMCSTLHIAGASISSIGVTRYWKSRFTPARPGVVASPVRTIGPYLIVAIALHAVYNLSAIVYELFIPISGSFFGFCG